jgi:hypothetical protein
VREFSIDPEVLRIAVGTQPLFALGDVFGEQRLLVDLPIHGRLIGHRKSTLPGILPPPHIANSHSRLQHFMYDGV